MTIHALSLPNSRSTAPRWRYRSRERLESRGMSGCSRSAFEPHRLGLALAGGAAPLGCLALVVRPGERPFGVGAAEHGWQTGVFRDQAADAARVLRFGMTP